MSEIPFTKAIRMVHPDSNPNVTDSGDKVKTIMMYKNEPKKMYNCLVAWGLIKNTKTQKILIERIDRIFKNRMYNGSVVVKHKRFDGYYEVKRTTNKRVYFTDATVKRYGMKYCSGKSVKEAFIKV